MLHVKISAVILRSRGLESETGINVWEYTYPCYKYYMSGYLKLSLGTKDLVMTITASGVVIVVRQLKLTCEAITSHVSAWVQSYRHFSHGDLLACFLGGSR